MHASFTTSSSRLPQLRAPGGPSLQAPCGLHQICLKSRQCCLGRMRQLHCCLSSSSQSGVPQLAPPEREPAVSTPQEQVVPAAYQNDNSPGHNKQQQAEHSEQSSQPELQDTSQPEAAQQAAAATDDTPSAASSSTSSSGPMPFVYTIRCYQGPDPLPVQMPPPDASPEPADAKPWFPKSKYLSPSFLQYYPAPKGSSYNFLSFLGSLEHHEGKYMVPGHKLEDFLRSYYNTTALQNRRVYLAESYQGLPYKFFQELDFPWSLDLQLVLELVPKVVAIVTEEVSRMYAHQVSAATTLQPVLSMRTIYKVHINFPGIYTVEAKAVSVRKAIINRCRVELSGQPPLTMLKQELVLQEHLDAAQVALKKLQELVQQLQGAGQQVHPDTQQLLAQLKPSNNSSREQHAQQAAAAAAVQPSPHDQQQQQQHASHPQQQAAQPLQQVPALQQQGCQQQELDWESIIDFPHGSLRLLGSCKAPWMDSDPAWVTEKCYSRVAQSAAGTWMRQPLTLASVLKCSIQMSESELRVFEQSEEFLEFTYQAVDQREQVLAAKRLLRAVNREVEQLLQQQQGGDSSPQSKPKQHQEAAQQGAAKRTAKATGRQAAKAQQKQQQQQRQEALAKMQAAAASITSKRAAAGPIRPSHIPAWPAPQPPAAGGPASSPMEEYRKRQ